MNNYNTNEEKIKLFFKNIKNNFVVRANYRKLKEGLLEEFITNLWIENGLSAPTTRKLTNLVSGIKSYVSFLLSDRVQHHNKDNSLLAIPSNFTRIYFKNHCNLGLKNTEISIINKLLLINIQQHAFANSSSNNSWSNGYIINRKNIEHILSLSTSTEDTLPREYFLLRDANRVFSFNSDKSFTLTYGNNRNIKINSTCINPDNIDELEENDLVINIFEKLKNTDKIVNKLQKLKLNIEKAVVNKKINYNTGCLRIAQIDSALSMLNFMETNEYWIDIYRVAGDGRLYALGANWQCIPKFIRKIVFFQCIERDQTAAQLQIICDLSDNCAEKEIVKKYLSNQNETLSTIKEENGKGKKWFKIRRSAAIRGHIFSDVLTSIEATSVCNSLKILASKLDWSIIIKEERRRTLELVSNNEILVWLHDGVIVR